MLLHHSILDVLSLLDQYALHQCALVGQVDIAAVFLLFEVEIDVFGVLSRRHDTSSFRPDLLS
jgi:hypothetical protein